jgi:hypothetical protein
MKPESDYLAFDDVLNSIGIERQTYTRRKPLDNLNDSLTDIDYMNIENNSVTLNTYNDLSDQLFNVLNDKDDEKDWDIMTTPTEATTEMVIDLLEVARKKIVVDTMATTKSGIYTTLNKLASSIGN